jgi:hypothetical protein
MFIICIPNIIHDYINIISDEYNININKSKAIFTNGYYFYKIDKNLTSGVEYKVISDNTEIFITSSLNANNNHYILLYETMYDTGIAKIYHDYHDNIIMINNNVFEVDL